MSWNRLVYIFDYYDQPRSGVAFIDSRLIAFKCLWNEEADDYSPEYEVSFLPSDLLPLIEERTSIIVRWNAALRTGKTSMDTHPALPSDRDRYDELQSILDTKHEENCERLRPTFRLEEQGRSHNVTLPENWRVNWNKG